MLNKQKKVHVFGHQNPDTDSTCSAIAYAYLKNAIDAEFNYIPAILGEVNPETEFVLSYFSVEKPVLVKCLKPQVSDIALEGVACAHEMESIRMVLEKIVKQTGRAIPVVDKNERLMGIISISDVVPMLLEANKKEYLKDVIIPMGNLIETLELTKVFGTLKENMICGSIYIFSDSATHTNIQDQDVVICTELEFNTGAVSALGAGYTIISDSVEALTADTSKKMENVVFTSTKNTYQLILAITQAFPIGPAVKKDNLMYFTVYETIDDVKKNMTTSQFHRFPVVDEQGYIQGILSRSDLVNADQKRVILMDHNEKGQSIQGIESVTIMEVIDHHRVADIQTMGPLYFRVEPVGSTCTIVSKMYWENNIPLPKEIAGILLSGILSDTLLFKSPTCTPIDQQIAERLGAIADIPIQAFGIQLITKGVRQMDESPESLIASDMKRFTFGEYKVSISQMTTGDYESFFKIYPLIRKKMEEISKQEKIELMIFMVTNIIIGGTEVIALGEAKWIADRAFNMHKNDESIFLNNVFSRKKQIVPMLMKAAQL